LHPAAAWTDMKTLLLSPAPSLPFFYTQTIYEGIRIKDDASVSDYYGVGYMYIHIWRENDET
jgi:hypothetical protein